MEEPTKDPRRQGGKRLDATVGLARRPQGGVLGRNSFFLNADLPVLQTLDRPQLKKRSACALNSSASSWRRPACACVLAANPATIQYHEVIIKTMFTLADMTKRRASKYRATAVPGCTNAAIDLLALSPMKRRS